MNKYHQCWISISGLNFTHQPGIYGQLITESQNFIAEYTIPPKRFIEKNIFCASIFVC